MSYPFLQDVVYGIFGVRIWLPLPTFGMMVAIAALSGFAVFRVEVKRLESLKRLPVKPFRLSENVNDFAVVLLICGMAGARIFSILEDPSDFFRDPLGILFSSGGLAIYGGLICGFFSGVVYMKRKKFPLRLIADASCLGLMLSYAVGRIGCQIAGDGDWGLPSNMSLKPAWLPDWFWAQTYEHNVLGKVIPLPGVYPTPMYESAAAFVLFGILWACRKHPFQTGWLFSLYLVFVGLERVLIERIRVNVKYSVAGFEFTQAEFISVILLAIGIYGLIRFSKKRHD